MHNLLKTLTFVSTKNFSRDGSLYFLQFSVFVNEEGNLVADRAVDVAVTYIKKNNKLGVNVDPARVVGNRSDASGLLDACKFCRPSVLH